MDETEKLLNLKKDIEDAKTNIAKSEGKKEALVKELKDQWKCTTIKQAEKKLQEHTDEAQVLNNQIMERVEKLEETYEL